MMIKLLVRGTCSVRAGDNYQNSGEVCTADIQRRDTNAKIVEAV